MSRFKNHYQTLGLADFSSPDEVKSAYRKLARTFHPDLNTNNPQAEDRFKEVNEAYSILSSPEKRALYDNQLKIMQGVKQKSTHNTQATTKQPSPNNTEPEAGQAAQQHTASKAYEHAKNATPPPTPPTDENKGFQGIFNRFLHREKEKESTPGSSNSWGVDNVGKNVGQWFQNSNAKSPSNTPNTKPLKHRGEDVTVDTQLNEAESQDGVIKTLFIKHHDLCPHCHATGKINGKLCKKCHGEKTLVRNKKVDVHIPAGVQEGSKVRVAGEGGRGLNGGDNGDLYLLIHTPTTSKTEPSNPPTPDNLIIKGLDVHSEIYIMPEDAVLGTQINVETLSKPVAMTIPAGTTSGKTFRLKGLGVKGKDHSGDHYVKVIVQTPDQLSAEEKALYEQLRKMRQKNQP